MCLTIYKNHFHPLICGYVFFTKSKAHREFVKFAVKLFYKNHFNQIICGYFFTTNREMVRNLRNLRLNFFIKSFSFVNLWLYFYHKLHKFPLINLCLTIYKNHFHPVICGYVFFTKSKAHREFVKFAVKTFFKNHFHLWLKNREMVKEFVKIREIRGKQFFIKMKSKHLI